MPVQYKNKQEAIRSKPRTYYKGLMRHNLYNPDTTLMRYGIREIVDVSQKLESLVPGFEFTGENIGDPVAKGWDPPSFLKDIIVDAVKGKDRNVFAYSHSKGKKETRQWIIEESGKLAPSSKLSYEDITFTNGLGAAISCIYSALAPGARIIQPIPAYPAHISMERFAAGSETMGYMLNPNDNWNPDIEDLESKIKQNPGITGILLINPNNPTGSVYNAEILEKVIRLAEQYNLMIISDEVYFRMVFNNTEFVHITEMAANRVPLIVMRGLSKDVPWPGARCGWLEFHNTTMDAEFHAYIESLKKRVMMEVCATTLPQYLVPKIYGHPDYPAWLKEINTKLEQSSNIIADILSKTPGLKIKRIQGAFYLMPVFEDGMLNRNQTLPIPNSQARKFIENAVADPNFPVDKRFAYYLLASTGICVVPASDFEYPTPGFRVTALDRNPEKLKNTYTVISESIQKYVASAG